ncbi:MAG: hypothetical protein IKN38_10160 [Clostridia bacterium]|nr:hypothetical protein [Clostridia bacterium]
MKKIVSLMLSLVMLVFLASCGESGDPQETEAEKVIVSDAVGHYVCVRYVAWDFPIDDEEELAKLTLDVLSDGSGYLSSGTDASEFTWTEDGDKIVFRSGNVTEAALGRDVIMIDDWMGLGLEYIFAKEGTPAADPALYKTLSDDESASIGTWTSYAIVDYLGEDLSDTYNADALVITVNEDYTVDMTLDGEKLETQTWEYILGSFNLVDGVYNVEWNVKDGELHVDIELEDGYVTYICKK